jgi:uncharacterized protein (TIGR02099 family)
VVHLLKSFAAKLWAALLALVIAAGALTAAAELLTPLLGTLRERVEVFAESVLRAPVQIGSMAVRWHRWGPELALREVAVLDRSGRESIRLRELTLGADLGDLLTESGMQPWRIGVAGVRLSLVRGADGALRLRDVGAGEAGVGEPAAAAVFLMPERVHITRAEVVVEDEMRGRPPLRFRDVDVVLRNQGPRHQANASLQLPAGGRLRLAADIHAGVDRLVNWEGQVYMEAENIDLSNIGGALLTPPYAVHAGSGRMRIWSYWRGGLLDWIEGGALIEDVRLSGEGPAAAWERLGGRFSWVRESGGWQLRVRDFVSVHAGEAPPPAEWHLASREEGGARIWRLAAEHLSLQQLAAVAAIVPTEDAAGHLLAAKPRGELHDVRASLRLDGGNRRWHVAGTATGLGLDPHGAFPGGENFALAFDADPTGGRAALHTRGARFDAPRVFREPLPIGVLDGEVRWSASPEGGWRIESDALTLDNEDIRTLSRIRLDFPPDRPPVIDLQTAVRDAVAARTPRYLPVGKMKDQDVIEWLDRAFLTGRVTEGTVIVRGPLPDFPYDIRRTGHFEAVFGVEDLDLLYDPEWPPVTQLEAEARFWANSLEIRGDAGAIYGSRIAALQARMEEVDPGGPVEIQATLLSSLEDGLRLLGETPLREHFGTVAARFEGAGDVRLALDLAVPVSKKRGELRVAGSLGMTGATLSLPEWRTALTGLTGDLGFSLDGLQAKGIDGQLDGIPVRIDVQTTRDGRTDVAMKAAKLSVRTIADRLAIDLRDAQGQSDWTLTVEAPPLQSPSPVTLRAASELTGVAVNLPSPLGKPAAAARRLSVELALPPEGLRPLGLRYGDILGLKLLLDPDGSARRGTVAFGDARPELPAKDVLAIRGAAGGVDVDAWIGWCRERGVRPPAGSPPVDADLRVAEIRLMGAPVSAAELQIQQTAPGWVGSLRARELSGDFVLPSQPDRGSARVKLDRLALELTEGEDEGAVPPKPPSQTDPRGLPGLELQIGQISINGHPFGTLRLTAERVPDGLQVDELTVDGPAGRLRGTARWSMQPSGAATMAGFALDTSDLGHIMVALGFADVIDRAPGQINGNLTWPGSPADFARERVDGKIDLKLGKGRFLDIDPGMGRLLGVLNIAALQRRLSLDFSDLFGKGLGFDEIKGHFEQRRGNMYTKDLVIRSPSSLIEITGRTGVAARDFDQQVTVTPSLGSAIPIAGAVAGGPVVGGALLIAQQLLSKQVDRIGQVRYSVKGPWGNPKIEVIKIEPAVAADSGAAPASAAPRPAEHRESPAPVEDRSQVEPAERTPRETVPTPAFH